MKRFLSLLMVLAMVLAMVPAVAAESATICEAGITLVLGDNAVSPDQNYDYTAYYFYPDVTGTYTLTVSGSGAVIGRAGYYWAEVPTSTGTSYELTCTSVGQPFYVGVSKTATGVNVAKTAEYVDTTVKAVAYVNTAKDIADASAGMPEIDTENGEIWSAVGISGAHDVVLGADGYYHLDSASGPVVYLNLKKWTMYPLPEGTGFKATTADGTYYEFRNALEEYADSNTKTQKDGIFKLTEDLALFLQSYGPSKLWQNEMVNGTEDIGFFYDDVANAAEGCEWLLYCYYVYSPVVEEVPAGLKTVDFADLKDGDTVLITMHTSPEMTNKDFVLLNNGGTKTKGSAAVFDSENYDGTMTWIVDVTDDGVIFYNNSEDGDCLYTTGANNGVCVGTYTTGTVWTLDDSGYLATTASDAVRYLGVYDNNGGDMSQVATPNFRAYKNTTNNTKDQTLTLYLVGEGAELPEVEDVPVTPPSTDPTPDTELTIAQAIELGASKAHDTYTTGKYYVTGEITEVYQTTYGNMKITDEAGNVLTVYGTYNEDGTVRYGDLEVKPVAGDTVKLYGIIGQYNGTAQMKNGWIVEHTPGEGGEPVTPPSTDPTPDTELTIAQAIELGESKTTDYTAGKYYLTGEITEIKNATYGNVVIKDAAGDSILIYGTWSADGQTRYDALEVKPVTGDTVKVYGVIGQYNGTAQMKNGWIVEHVPVVPEIPDPTPDTELTIPEASELGVSKAHNVYTAGKYYVTGIITEVEIHETNGDKFGNMTIADEKGNTLYIYGTWNAEGTVRYGELEVKPVAGDTVKLYGVIGNYSDKAQMKNGWIMEHIPAAPVEGTQENPIVLNPQTVNEVTFSGTKYYSASNVGGMIATITGATSAVYNGQTYNAENGIITISGLTAGRGVPAIFAITGEGAGTVSFNFPLGTWQNPDTLVLGDTTVTAGPEGYELHYTAEKDGVLNVVMISDDYVATLGNNDAIFSSDYMTSTSVEMKAGEEVVLIVGPETMESKEISFSVEFKDPAGSQNNPIVVSAEEANALTVSGTQYYAAYNVGGMIANITGATSAIYNGQTYNAVDGKIVIEGLEAARGVPAVLGITANGAVTLSFSYATGHPMNPAVLVMGENTATVEADSMDGYVFSWTAAETGTLTLTLPESGWVYTVNNMTAGVYGDMIYSDSTDVSHVYEVTAGDDIQIMMNSYDPNSWNTPAAAITFTAAFEVPVGTEENPIVLNPQAVNEVTFSGTKYYSASNVGGMIATITGATSAVYNGQTYNAENGSITIPGLTAGRGVPAIFAITGEGAGTISFNFPLGTWQNPDTLVLGDTTVTAGSEGYELHYIPESDGTLIINMISGDWMLSLGNNDRVSCEDEETSFSLAVKAGEEVIMIVAPGKSWDATEISFTASFQMPAGSEENPIAIGESYTATQNGTVYYSVKNVSDYTATITGAGLVSSTYNGQTVEAADGKVVLSGITGSGYAPAIFAITGNGTFQITLSAPVGTWQNPDTLALGDTTVKAGAEGYHLTYTAEKDGVLTVILSGEDYMATLGNNDAIFSEDGMTTTSVEMKAGEEVTLIVAPGISWDAIDITFTAEFKGPAGAEDNPIVLNVEQANALTFSGTQYYAAYNVNGMTANITGAASVSYNGQTYNAENGTIVIENLTSERGAPAIFAITGEGAGTVLFTYPLGTWQNPDTLVLGDTTVTAGIDGYELHYTAESTGTLTITMTSDDWALTLGNNDMVTCEDGVTSSSVEVTAGEEIVVIVAPGISWNATQISFTASFQEPAFTKGDVDGNGVINNFDLLLLLYHTNKRTTLEGTRLLAADVDGNGKVDVWDVSRMVLFLNKRIDKL